MQGSEMGGVCGRYGTVEKFSKRLCAKESVHLAHVGVEIKIILE